MSRCGSLINGRLQQNANLATFGHFGCMLMGLTVFRVYVVMRGDLGTSLTYVWGTHARSNLELGPAEQAWCILEGEINSSATSEGTKPPITQVVTCLHVISQTFCRNYSFMHHLENPAHLINKILRLELWYSAVNIMRLPKGIYW